MPVPDKFKRYDIVRHIASGKLYRIQLTPSDGLRLEATAEQAYLYGKRAEDVPEIWCRSRAEMEDGRFELEKSIHPEVKKHVST